MAMPDKQSVVSAFLKVEHCHGALLSRQLVHQPGPVVWVARPTPTVNQNEEAELCFPPNCNQVGNLSYGC